MGTDLPVQLLKKEMMFVACMLVLGRFLGIDCPIQLLKEEMMFAVGGGDLLAWGTHGP